jgi:hypothetical protein
MKINGPLRVFGTIKSDESAWQQPVLDIQTDAVLDPGASPATGARYILTDVGALHANFGTITGVGDDDLVEFDGTDFQVIYDASATGEGAVAWDIDSSALYQFDGSAWGIAGHPGGGDGVTFNVGQNRFDLDLATTSGLELTAADGTGELRTSAQGNGIAGGAGAVLSVDPATEVAGSRAAVYVAADGVGVDVDNSTLTHASSTLQIKDSGVNTTQLATDAVETAKITDANVTVAKIEVLAEAELIVGNGSANSKVDTSSVGDILSDETNGLTIKASAVDTTELADDAVTKAKLDHADTKLRSGSATDAFATTTKTFTHSWSTTDVQVEVFDVTTGETCYVDSVVRTSAAVIITVGEVPTNSLRVTIREVDPTETTLVVT